MVMIVMTTMVIMIILTSVNISAGTPLAMRIAHSCLSSPH